jgi:excisionase family DNA binding protein
MMAPQLTTSYVAGLLDVSPRSIRLWAGRGELRGIKVGRQWRFRREALRKWLQEANRAEKNISSFA